MPSIRLMRLWNTVRWLKSEQVYSRIWRKIYRPRADWNPAPPRRGPEHRWKGCPRRQTMTGPDVFRFIGTERRIASAADWNRVEWTKLWLYNLHYHDDLVADGAVERGDWHRALIARWIAENPPVHGIGWEPYPISLRSVNWIKWELAGNALSAEAQQNLAVQARHLAKCLETHLLGNHLWANAKALVFVGAFFGGSEAQAWRTRGLMLMRRELLEQVLPDGGHFELSPMYHAIVLEDLLDLVQLGTVYPGLFPELELAQWRDSAARMLRWLRVMSHPDGGIAFFNDAALGIGPNLAALAAYACALGVPEDTGTSGAIEALPDSGYVRLQAGNAVLIADVARVGPDYQPGHAHADTLSFELSLGERRILVNGGTSTYEAGVERLEERGTVRHNTVMVDGADSSEVWAAFRVARRAMPFDVRWGQDGEVLWLEASHDGYRRIRGGPVHRRRWELRAKRLRVLDTLVGRFGEAVARFRFAPECDNLLQWVCEGQTRAEVVPGTWHPRFGVSEPCRLLEIRCDGGRIATEFTWG